MSGKKSLKAAKEACARNELSNYEFNMIVRRATEQTLKKVQEFLLPLLSGASPARELILRRPIWSVRDISILYGYPRKTVETMVDGVIKTLNGARKKRLYDPQDVKKIFGEVPQIENHD